MPFSSGSPPFGAADGGFASLPVGAGGLVFAGLVGLAVGSFLNSVATRLPRGESPLRGRSRCPRCGSPIRIRDNLPLVSYAALAGRCRDCRAGIPLRYPLVEAGGAAAALSGAALVPEPALLAAWFLFLCLTLTLLVTDWEHLVLPDSLTLGGAGAGFLLAVPRPDLTLLESAAGAALGFGLLAGLRALWLRFRGVEAIGRGDLKLELLLGAFLGPVGVLHALVLASGLGLLAALPLLLLGRIHRDTPLPFGAALCLAGAACFVRAALFEA